MSRSFNVTTLLGLNLRWSYSDINFNRLRFFSLTLRDKLNSLLNIDHSWNVWKSSHISHGERLTVKISNFSYFGWKLIPLHSGAMSLWSAEQNDKLKIKFIFVKFTLENVSEQIIFSIETRRLDIQREGIVNLSKVNLSIALIVHTTSWYEMHQFRCFISQMHLHCWL